MNVDHRDPRGLLTSENINWIQNAIDNPKISTSRNGKTIGIVTDCDSSYDRIEVAIFGEDGGQYLFNDWKIHYGFLKINDFVEFNADHSTIGAVKSYLANNLIQMAFGDIGQKITAINLTRIQYHNKYTSSTLPGDNYDHTFPNSPILDDKDVDNTSSKSSLQNKDKIKDNPKRKRKSSVKWFEKNKPCFPDKPVIRDFLVKLDNHKGDLSRLGRELGMKASEIEKYCNSNEKLKQYYEMIVDRYMIR